MNRGRYALSALVVLASLLSGCDRGAAVRWSEPVGGLSVGDLSVAAPVLAGSTAIYFHVRNQGTSDDTIVTVTLGGLGRTSIYRTVVQEGVSSMLPEGPLLVPAGETVTLRPGGLHVMVEGLPGNFTVGDSMEVSIQFANAGWLVGQADVRSRDVIHTLFPAQSR